MKVYRVTHTRTLPFTVDELKAEHPGCAEIGSRVTFETIFKTTTDEKAIEVAKDFEDDILPGATWETKLFAGKILPKDMFIPGNIVYQNSSGIARMA